MIEWDLYLDESGAFKKKGEHTLIGGFLLPHHQVNKNMFEEWRQDIRNRIEDAKTITKQQLDDGDWWLQLDFKKKRKAFLEDDQQKLNQIHQRGYYVFDYCNKNEKQAFRWRTQRWVLEQYMEKIRSAKGYPVIFDNPRGVYHVDSNTTFMSIIANGLTRLYNDLKRRDPDKKLLCTYMLLPERILPEKTRKTVMKYHQLKENGIYWIRGFTLTRSRICCF